MLPNLKHWRLNDQEKMSNLNLYNDLKDATASAELVRTHTPKKKSVTQKNTQLMFWFLF